jgi:hypothetical protein
MLSIISLLFTSILSGGATGLLGVVLQRFFDHQNKKLDLEKQRIDNAHEERLRDLDMQMLDKEWAHKAEVAKIETEGASDVAASNAFAASFAMEPKRYSEGAPVTPFGAFILVMLDFIRGIVRPGLTIYLCILTTLVWQQARVMVALEDLTSDQAMEIMKLVIGTILYLTTTCVLWWFGTRNKQEQPKINK